MISSGPSRPEFGDLLAGRAPLRTRLREGRFWAIQALVAVFTSFHVLVEWLESRGELTGIVDGIHDLPVPGYVIPVLLAGLWYGLEGGLFTGIATTVASFPNLIIFHSENYEWLGEITTNLLVVGIGIVAARSIELTRRSQLETASSNRRLTLLRDVDRAIRDHPSTQALLEDVVELLAGGAGVGAVAFFPSPGALHSSIVAGPDRVCREWLRDRGATAPEGQNVRRVRVATERADFGVLVLGCSGGVISDEDATVIAVAAAEVAGALETDALLESQRSSLQHYARGVTAAQEEERKRIARELHDGPAQSMVVLSRGLARLSEKIAPESEGLVGDLEEVAKRTLRSLRRTTEALRPPLLDDLGLASAVRSLAERYASRDGLRVDTVVDGTVRRLGPDVELAAFRITQEALTNVSRHAQTDSASVLLRFDDEAFALSIRDDGVGFDTDDAPADRFGLVGMRERANLVGGTLSVESAPGRGTRIAFEAST